MKIWAGFIRAKGSRQWLLVGAWRNSKIACQETQKASFSNGHAKIVQYLPTERYFKRNASDPLGGGEQP